MAVAATLSRARLDGYERRRPDETLLYRLIERHWPSFRARAEEAGGLPKFVVDEFDAYLRCGLRVGQMRGVPGSRAMSADRFGPVLKPSLVQQRLFGSAALVAAAARGRRG